MFSDDIRVRYLLPGQTRRSQLLLYVPRRRQGRGLRADRASYLVNVPSCHLVIIKNDESTWIAGRRGKQQGLHGRFVRCRHHLTISGISRCLVQRQFMW